MKYLNRYVFISTFASILGFTPQVYATDLSGNFDVTITITSMCTMDTTSGGNVAFGPQPSAATNIQVSSVSILVTCTQGNSVISALGAGGNADGSSRRMEGVSDASQFVAYELYSDAYSTLWGNGTIFGAVKGDTGIGSSQAHTIYGQVPSANALAQDYKDTVTATVTW